MSVVSQSVEVTIGPFTFTNAAYDARGDVLYLDLADPRAAVDGYETREGHLWRFDAAGSVVGVTLISAQRILDLDGVITITLPPARIDAADLAGVLTAAP